MVVCRLWHLCQPRYPRFVHFSWSFPVNWYIQSILLYPAIKSVTFVSARFSIPMRNCRLVFLFQAFIPTSGIQTPMPSTCLFSLPASYSSLRLHFSSVLLVDSCCRRNTTHLVHVMTCILPLSFFSFLKSFIFFLAFRRTMHDPFMFSTLRFILHDPPCIAYSLRLLSSSKHFISTR